ncbi:hypothetical protein JKP88DRAFT_275423 [Tribonema minus]|uniref:Uncharacterized protein n=1 Tax=Tribonema minus TaxID=303371 RepID=A0A835ZAU9_9STRA|nr:hypothetical protein JKP88DRAFT_275423 [Tribonema minus]
MAPNAWGGNLVQPITALRRGARRRRRRRSATAAVYARRATAAPLSGSSDRSPNALDGRRRQERQRLVLQQELQSTVLRNAHDDGVGGGRMPVDYELTLIKLQHRYYCSGPCSKVYGALKHKSAEEVAHFIADRIIGVFGGGEMGGGLTGIEDICERKRKRKRGRGRRGVKNYVFRFLPGASTAINATTAVSYFQAGNYPAAGLYALGTLPLPFSSWVGFIFGSAATATETGTLFNRFLHMMLTVLSNPQYIASGASVILWLSARLQFIPGVAVVGKIASEATIKMSALIAGIFGTADHALHKVEWSKSDDSGAKSNGAQSDDVKAANAEAPKDSSVPPPRQDSKEAPAH